MAYSEKQKTTLTNTICKRIEEGEALRTVLMEKDMPSNDTFYSWIDLDDEKLEQYTRATNSRADKIFEDILEIADKQGKDVYEIIVDGISIEKTDHNVINRSKLQVDTRKWMVGKMNPKKYGDASKLTLDGGLKVNLKQITGMKIE